MVRVISCILTSVILIGSLIFAVQVSPAEASCRMRVHVTHNPNQVQAELINTCGDRVRAWGNWGGKYRYGTYLFHNYSTACDDSPGCQDHPDGNLFHGGWQDRRTGKYHQTF